MDILLVLAVALLCHICPPFARWLEKAPKGSFWASMKVSQG